MLLLMNNDVVLHPNCLRSMLATFRTMPRPGLVAPFFINTQGVVLEAGGLILRSANVGYHIS